MKEEVRVEEEKWPTVKVSFKICLFSSSEMFSKFSGRKKNWKYYQYFHRFSKTSDDHNGPNLAQLWFFFRVFCLFLFHLKMKKKSSLSTDVKLFTFFHVIFFSSFFFLGKLNVFRWKSFLVFFKPNFEHFIFFEELYRTKNWFSVWVFSSSTNWYVNLFFLNLLLF